MRKNRAKNLNSNETGTCENCGKVFNLRGLGPHRAVCTKPKQSAKCDLCGKVFNVRGLGPHRKFCTGVTEAKTPSRRKKTNRIKKRSSGVKRARKSKESKGDDEEMENDSGIVLIRVRSRKRWKTSVRELVGLCSEAQRQRTLRNTPGAKTFRAPISQQFVEDTIELMQPLYGWMVRRTSDGHLRGFLLCTTFTTWVGPSNLRWVERRTHAKSRAAKRPPDLASQLNASVRYGAPLTTGVVWPRVAEISLVGALGCGRLLVHELLRRLKSGAIVSPSDNKPYEYVALQATKNAISFYERIGFQHIEAEARHFTTIVGGRVDPDKLGPWMPFRHFEYVVPDGLEASHMMALRLDKLDVTFFSAPEWDVVGENGSIDKFLRGGGQYKKGRVNPTWFSRHLRTICSENARLAPKTFRRAHENPSRGGKRRRDDNASSVAPRMVPKSVRLHSKRSTAGKSLVATSEKTMQCKRCLQWFHPRGYGPHRTHCKVVLSPAEISEIKRNGGSTSGHLSARSSTSPAKGNGVLSIDTESPWDCSRCTLINMNGGMTCEACGFMRPGMGSINRTARYRKRTGAI